MSKILVIAGFRDSVVKFRGHLISDLKKRGHKVHVASPDIDSSGTAEGWFEKAGVTPHNVSFKRASISPFSDILAVVQLFRLVRRIRPYACLTYTVKPNIYGTLAAWAGKVPKRIA